MKQEIPPTIKTIIDKELLKYIIYLFLYNKIIPAVTKVAECSNALTGVGPSIASNNQG
jgi:hypothetical protein